MKNILFKLLFAAFLFFFSGIKILAQSNTDSAAEKLSDDFTSSEALGDTTLNKTYYQVEDDSLKPYKKDRDFAYMKYLDSLLRQTKDLTTDTVAANNSNLIKRRNSASQAVNRKPSINFLNSSVVKIFLWILAIAFIAFVLYKLFDGANLFKRNRTVKDVYNTQEGEENVSDVAAFDKMIMQAVKNKNYRLAVRYHYLQTLQRLSDAAVVQLSADKTNYQYVSELRNRSYQNDFAAVTLNYEYVWYGKFEITESTYNKVSQDFKYFNQKI